jgi:hypothetical protein
MVDRLKDNEDRLLESLFRSEPVPDNGFSRKIVFEIKRRIWIRRLTLPAAFVVGAAIAVKPLSQLAVTFSKLLTLIPAKMPTNVGSLSLGDFPHISTVILGGLLLVAMMMVSKLLEE